MQPLELKDGRDVDVLAPRAPWRRLPVELLSDIFVMALKESLDCEGKSFDRENESFVMPTRISLVCTEWRAVALGTPRLWTRVQTSDERGLRTALLWLERSGSAPVVIQCIFNDCDCVDFSGVLGVVCSHLGHILDLNISIASGHQYLPVIQELSSPAPILQSLRIRAIEEDDDHWDVPDDIAQSLFGGKSPTNLLSLSIISSGSKWPEGIMDHLTELDLTALGNTNAVDAFQLLKDARCVTTLNLHVFGHQWSSFVTVATLPALLHFRINGWIHQVQQALNHLDLPNLLSLSVYYDDTSSAQEVDVTAGMTLPFPLLETLRCICMGQVRNAHHLHLFLVLQKCSSLRRLEIGGSPDQLLMKLLLIGGGTGILCPHLAHLTIDKLDQIPWDNLRQVIHTYLDIRNKSGGGFIETVSFRNFPPLLKFDQLDDLRTVVKLAVYYNEVLVLNDGTLPQQLTDC